MSKAKLTDEQAAERFNYLRHVIHDIEVMPRKATEGTRMKLRLAKAELERLRPQVREYWRRTNEHNKNT